jgi:ferredoxin
VIFGEWKPIEEIVESLKGGKRVLVVGCATCVAECAAGGEKEVEILAPLLSLATKKRGKPIEITTATVEKQCEYELVETIAGKAEQADTLLSLACGIGVQVLAERFGDKRVLPGVNTSALTVREEAGIWASRCDACGDCVLGETQGYCPIARCSKSLMNGPCGGTSKNGKCEISEDTDCIWKLIVERAELRGELELLAKIRNPKNWSRARSGGPKRVVREELRQ